MLLVLASIALFASLASAARPGPDLLLLARCHAVCAHSSPLDKRQCIRGCEEKPWEKGGECPSDGAEVMKGCLTECAHDGNCPGVLRCCSHACGVTCQNPQGLATAPGLPTMVEDVTVTIKRSKSASISWRYEETEGALFVLEERHHAGPQFVERTVGDWGPLHKSPRSRPPVRLQAALFNLGTWYQIRVASVNINGSRGFSQPSKAFNIRSPPKKPEPPGNLKCSSATYKNGSVSVIFSWDPPVSDIPITRYTVYWSKRLASRDTPASQGSIHVQQKTISHERTSIRLRKLLPNVSYFLQVQAHSQFGKQHFISEKSSLEFNTANAVTQSALTDKSERTPKGKEISVKRSKFTVVDNQLTTKISWKSRANAKYVVSWESSCGLNVYKSVTVTDSFFDLTGLQSDCKYNVIVREKSGGKKARRSGKIEISTPPCKQFTPPIC